VCSLWAATFEQSESSQLFLSPSGANLVIFSLPFRFGKLFFFFSISLLSLPPFPPFVGSISEHLPGGKSFASSSSRSIYFPGICFSLRLPLRVARRGIRRVLFRWVVAVEPQNKSLLLLLLPPPFLAQWHAYLTTHLPLPAPPSPPASPRTRAKGPPSAASNQEVQSITFLSTSLPLNLTHNAHAHTHTNFSQTPRKSLHRLAPREPFLSLSSAGSTSPSSSRY
jgi:hypothetical protein